MFITVQVRVCTIPGPQDTEPLPLLDSLEQVFSRKAQTMPGLLSYQQLRHSHLLGRLLPILPTMRSFISQQVQVSAYQRTGVRAGVTHYKDRSVQMVRVGIFIWTQAVTCGEHWADVQ